MLVAWMLPGDDDQPATRRDVSSARESIEHKVRADIAEARTEMSNGFRETDQKIAKVNEKVDQGLASVRTEMAGLRVEVANRSNKQTTFLAGLLIMSYGTLLVAVLRIS